MRIGIDILLLSNLEVVEIIPAERVAEYHLESHLKVHFESGGTATIEQGNINDSMASYRVISSGKVIESIEELRECIENY